MTMPGKVKRKSSIIENIAEAKASAYDLVLPVYTGALLHPVGRVLVVCGMLAFFVMAGVDAAQARRARAQATAIA